VTILRTIGYERFGLPGMLEVLAKEGVALVIDVRELPNSRRPGFAKRQLSAGLAEAGIGYRHFKALGTPKAGRLAHRAGRMAAFWEIVDAALAQPEAGLALAEAGELAAAQPACLLCLEAEPHLCHRARVAERMSAAGGLEIRHLHADQRLS
jgi:uncharacterized protein (DUF488 family)